GRRLDHFSARISPSSPPVCSAVMITGLRYRAAFATNLSASAPVRNRVRSRFSATFLTFVTGFAAPYQSPRRRVCVPRCGAGWRWSLSNLPRAHRRGSLRCRALQFAPNERSAQHENLVLVRARVAALEPGQTRLREATRDVPLHAG